MAAEESKAWRKVNKIEGVSAGSILELTAEVAQTAQAFKSGQRPAKIQKTTSGDVASNRGIDERIKRDKIQLKGDNKPLSVQIAASHSKLQEKEKVYDRFVRGEVLEPDRKRKQDEPLIDFEQKSWMQAKGLLPDEPQFYHHDIEQENDRRAWEESALQDDDAADEVERQRKHEQRKILNQMIEETREGREKHKSFQAKRQQVLEQRRQLIKQKSLARQAQQTTQTAGTTGTGQTTGTTGTGQNETADVAEKKSNRLTFKTK